MLSRFLRRTETVEGDGFNSQPLGRVVSVTETNWTSIPSDLPLPVRASIIGRMVAMNEWRNYLQIQYVPVFQWIGYYATNVEMVVRFHPGAPSLRVRLETGKL
jgi:hypothetical protein